MPASYDDDAPARRAAADLVGRDTGDAPSASAPEPLCHLVSLPGGPFGLWPWACLRGAGFAATDMLSVAADEASAYLDAKLAAGLTPNPRDPALVERFERDDERARQRLRALGRDDRFREAVLWQNRHAFKTGVEPLAATPPTAKGSNVRRKERLVALYLQRYCTKNDTIGFFGPVGWAHFGVGSAAAALRHRGEGLVAERSVHFETWCIDALGDALRRDEALRLWAPPRLAPYVRLEGTTLFLPAGPPFELPAAEAALLRACDGVRPARALAAELCTGPAPRFPSEEAVFQALELARSLGAIAWNWDVELDDRPERSLRRRLERVDDASARERGLAMLGRLERARDRVARAAGDPAALDAALGGLEDEFRDVTGAAATRAPGRPYAGRTLVYEDCTRATSVELGAPLLEALGPPLSLIAASARWLAAEVLRNYRVGLRSLYERLAQGAAELEFTTFLSAFLSSAPELVGQGGRPPRAVSDATLGLQRRWRQVLGAPPPDARRIAFTSAELRARALEAFAVDAANPWAARYFAPDVLAAADGPEALARGEARFVLGELHLINSLSSLLVSRHPAPHELFAMVDRECDAPVAVPVFSKDQWSQRTLPCLFPSDAYHVLLSNEPSSAPPGRTLRAADLLLARAGDEIEVRHRGGAPPFELLDFASPLLSFFATNAFEPFADQKHAPRITVDDLVIARESWSFGAAELTFAALDSPLARWVEAKCFQRRHGLPRFAFVRAPGERKPYFVDFDCPVLVELTAKLARQGTDADASASLRFSEMLPAFDELWLTDPQGRRYVSELRCVIYDLPSAKAGARAQRGGP